MIFNIPGQSIGVNENKMCIGLSYFYFPNGKFKTNWDNKFILDSIDTDNKLLIFKFERELELPGIETEMASFLYCPASIQLTFKDFNEMINRKCLRKEVEDLEEI